MLRQIALCSLVLMASAQAAVAYKYQRDERTPDEVRADSAPVVVGQSCRVTNAGVFDQISLGVAEPLGNGRFQQVVDSTNQALVYVADCNTREATLLRGPATGLSESFRGQLLPSYAPLAGPDAIMSLADGDTLQDMLRIAADQRVSQLNPLTYFFEFSYRGQNKPTYPVGDKDRFDLMCGCKRLYPGTAGAAQ